MRRALPLAMILVGLAMTSTLFAQNDRFAYAITDISGDGAGWNALRRIDLQNGTYSKVLLNGIDPKTAVFSATTKKRLWSITDAQGNNSLQPPFATGVAAAAYDKKHHRLYFTPMFINQLRYIDLRTMRVYYVNDQAFVVAGDQKDEARIITRMVIAPDDYGYAVSNDGNTLIRFSTNGRATSIEHLGALVDDPSNGGISIHNQCASYGGDMISDDMGNLYILSARNSVFTVNTTTRVAKYLGNIKGLQPNFTVNGAVVDAEGNLLVSSAVDASSYYVVNPTNWTATPFKASGGVFKSSDLANSNYLTFKRSNKEIQQLIRPQEKFASLISVYPNPVTTGAIKMQFNKVPVGNYTVELRDVLGQTVMQRKIAVTMEGQVEDLNIDAKNANGVYLIKLFDAAKRSVFTQKLVVQ